MAVPDPLRFPAAGRAASGIGVLVLAAPLCRAAGITNDDAAAKRLGRGIAFVDALGVAAVVTSSRPSSQRRAAALNTTIDVLGAAALLGLAGRRHGSQRIVSVAAAGFLLAGGMAWVRAARQIGPS